jgi:hypothetical protein
MRSTADEIEPSVAEQAMKPASFEDFYFDHHRDVYAAMWLVTGIATRPRRSRRTRSSGFSNDGTAWPR